MAGYTAQYAGYARYWAAVPRQTGANFPECRRIPGGEHRKSPKQALLE